MLKFLPATMKETLKRKPTAKIQSGDSQTHCSNEEGGRPFDALEPRSFTLPIDAHQLNEDVVGGGGLGKVRSGDHHLVLHHCGIEERRKPGGG